MPRASLPRSLRSVVTLLVVLLTATAFTGGPSLAATTLATPATPEGLTAAIEVAQPYIGQDTCDPVAKAGVVAFRDLLLATYPDTGSLGIVQNCGVNGQSEHKEGRAFDWAVSVNNPQQVAEVKALMTWLLATDSYGNTYAMAKRLGIMYMIWDHQMWRAYSNTEHQANHWDPYTGVSGHTDHVHFSFGWNGARKATSFWTGVVAPVYASGTDTGPAPTATGSSTNRQMLHRYGQASLQQGSTGDAVQALQNALRITADGDYGPLTARAVSTFQSQHSRPVTGTWGPADWATMFPVADGSTVGVDGATQRFSAYGSRVVLTGTAGPGAAVTLHFRSYSKAAGDFSVLRTVTADAAGAWQYPITVAGDNNYYATVGTLTSAPVLNLAVPSVDGPLNRVVPRGARYTLSGQAAPGWQVELRLRRADPNPGAFTIVRRVTADAAGRWSFSYFARADYSFYVLRAPGTDRPGDATWLVQAR